MNVLEKIMEAERKRLTNTAGAKEKLEALANDITALTVGRAAPQANEAVDAGRFRIVQTETAMAAAVEDLSGADAVTFDIETTGLDALTDTIVGFGLCANGTYGFYFPVGHEGAPGQLPIASVLAALTPLLTSKGIIAHNAKFELMFMRRLGVELPVTFDTMLGCQIVDEVAPAGLKEAAPRLLGVADWGLDLEKRPANRRAVREVGAYCIRDCLYTHRLYELLGPTMREQFPFVYYEVELPLIPVMAAMELNGFPVDVAYLDALRTKVATRHADLAKKIEEAAGHPLNVNSAPQLATVLYDELKLPVVERTDAGKPSTSADALEKLGAGAHPIIPLLQEYRQIEKLQSSYINPKVNPSTGRVHAAYMQIGTETGRMKGAGSFHALTFPNDGVHPFSLRKAVGGVDGFHVVCADFSSQEPRITASYSDDENMRKTFAAGLSIHASVAKMIFGLAEDVKSITKKTHPREYGVAKAIGLGVVYGKGAYSLAQEFSTLFGRDVPEPEAQAFIDRFFAEFPRVKTWLDSVIAGAKRDGCVEDMAGRRRRLLILKEKRRRRDKDLFVAQKSAEREAMNFMVQALAASMTKRAMVRCHRRLAELFPRTQLLAARHDELMFLVPSDEVDSACALIKECMENDPELAARGLTVKSEVGISYGATWSDDDQKKWEPAPPVAHTVPTAKKKVVGTVKKKPAAKPARKRKTS